MSMLANVHYLVLPIMFWTYAIGLDSADKELLADVYVMNVC